MPPEVVRATLPPLTVVRAVLRAEEAQRLPRFFTTAVHGALGRALYRMVCAFRERSTCTGCPLLRRCAYPALFETPGVDDPVLQAQGIRDMAPRPLVLAPEPDWLAVAGPSRVCQPGDEVVLRLTLVDGASADLPLVCAALERMARSGLGLPLDADGPQRRRASLSLVRVEDSAGTAVSASPTGVPPPVVIDADECFEGDHLRLHLLTPLRLTVAGRITGAPAPLDVIRALARRVNAFARLFGAAVAPADEGMAEDMARSIDAERARLRRMNIRRWSSRQRRRLELPGVLGVLEWRGAALRSLWPLLRWGELAQVGKGTSLGFGRYSLQRSL